MRVNTLSALPAIGFLLEAPLASAISQTDINEIMKWVNHFDGKYGLPQKTWNTTLYNNAQNTGAQNKGQTENHIIFPGTLAQVITPGKNIGDATGPLYSPYTNFQAAYLDWLCEVPNQPQLDGKCPEVLEKTCIDDSGSTGHNTILTSSQYHHIGCSFTTNAQAATSQCWHGIWVCDLA